MEHVSPPAMGSGPPPTMNHVGITVPDVIAAIDWYREVFGFRCLMGPRVLLPPGGAVPSPLGPRFRRAWQAHLVTADGVGLELFQFIDPPVEQAPRDIVFWRPGPWHLCLTHPDVGALAGRIVRAGGVQRHEPVHFVPGRPYQLVYCGDPWGTVIELMSHPYTEVFANWPQPGMTQPTTYVDPVTRTELSPRPLPDWPPQ